MTFEKLKPAPIFGLMVRFSPGPEFLEFMSSFSLSLVDGSTDNKFFFD